MPDLADKAIAYVQQQKSLTPDKPFFVYFAPGATHAPHHVPKDWIAKYTGKFDEGWDAARDATFARQKALGVIPADAVLTPRPDGIPAWSDIPAERRPILAHQMEVTRPSSNTRTTTLAASSTRSRNSVYSTTR